MTADKARAARGPDGKTLARLGLAVFLVWQAFELRSFTRAETRPPPWDQAVHLDIALDYRNALRGGHLEQIFHPAPKPGMPPFPPLYHLALMGIYDHSDPASAALWINWFYMALLCVSLFAITAHFRSDETALISVLLFAGTPALRQLYTTQLIDLSVVAWVAAAYWMLLLSRGFSRWSGALLFGAAYAAGMMHKWSFFSYMLPACFVGAKALLSRETRPRAAAALSLALAGFLPWYIVNLPVLVPRLLEASNDFGVRLTWGLFFSYFVGIADSVGPLFWIFGVAGLLWPAARRRTAAGYWLIPAWLAGSYLFWILVPNRQIRFFLPGLSGLAVAAVCGPWPKQALWALAAFNLFAGANYEAGWVRPPDLPGPLHALKLWNISPPISQDWEIKEILREAQRRHEKKFAVSEVTLVANDVYFNGPTITWESHLLGAPRLAMRPVTRRLCELSEFVVVKTGYLGHPSVIVGLPEAEAVILKKGGWFGRSYELVDQWALPDGSQAELFEQRKLKSPPIPGGRYHFNRMKTPAFAADNLDIDLGSWKPGASSYGAARMAASEVHIRGLRVSKARLEFDDFSIVPAGLDPRNPFEDVRFLRLGTLQVKSLDVSAEDFRGFLETRVKGLKLSRLAIDGSISAEGRFHRVPVSAQAQAALTQSPPSLRVSLTEAKIAGLPIPSWALSRLGAITIPFDPNPETPFAIELAGLSLKNGHLSVP